MLEIDERISRDDSASPPPGIGFSFATIQEPLARQRDGLECFQILGHPGTLLTVD